MAAPTTFAQRVEIRAADGRDDNDFDRIVALALHLEPHVPSVVEWLHTVPIPRLGDRTAIELVLLGQGEKVIELLRDALTAE